MKKYYFAIIFFCAFYNSPAQPPLGFTPYVSGLTSPVDIVNAADGSGRLFIVQQNGIVRIHTGGTAGSLLPAPFLNMQSVITYDAGGERGLLSIVFHPNFASNGYFFVYYNNTAGNVELAQFQRSSTDPNLADPASRKVMLTVVKPFSNHNGGKLNFGPDGNLYFGLGDGGSGGDPGNRSQNLNVLLGKMLRINVNNFNVAPYYTVPADNPYMGVPNTQPEIYSSGLRNPWRWSFDRTNGDMWIADVGQNAWEEVNRVPFNSTSGANYGWRCYEGTHAYDLSLCGATPAVGKTVPVFEYPHTAAGGFSITGGFVYRGTEYPSLNGWYICADYVRPNGWLIRPAIAGGYNVGTQADFPANISGFGDAEDGTLYLVTLGGTMYKVIVTGPVAVSLIAFNAVIQDHRDVLRWQITADAALQRFEIERSADGTVFTGISTLPAPQNQTDYSVEFPSLNADRYYRLKIISTGRIQYSPVKKIPGKPQEIIVTNNGSGHLKLINTISLENIFLINAAGQRVKSFASVIAGSHDLDVSALSKGIYFMQIIKPDKTSLNIKVPVY